MEIVQIVAKMFSKLSASELLMLERVDIKAVVRSVLYLFALQVKNHIHVHLKDVTKHTPTRATDLSMFELTRRINRTYAKWLDVINDIRTQVPSENMSELTDIIVKITDLCRQIAT